MSDRKDLLHASQGTARADLAGREGLDVLLTLLDPDRDRAAERYLSLRQRVVKYFGWRGTRTPDELADDTLDRVCRRLAEGERSGAGDPAVYVFGVARNVLREYWSREQGTPERLKGAPELLEDPRRNERDREIGVRAEQRLACLDECLQKLDPAARELILRYYRREKQAKIDDRSEMARGLGISVPALRLRLHRIRAKLEPCVKDCLARLAE